LSYNISRSQLPLVPAYAYTANKIQGQLLQHALVDLKSACSTQTLYVMISRVVSLENLGVLRWFPPTNLNCRLSQAYINEFERLKVLDEHMTAKYKVRKWKGIPYHPPQNIEMMLLYMYRQIESKKCLAKFSQAGSGLIGEHLGFRQVNR
jgi:hypothetical protein